MRRCATRPRICARVLLALALGVARARRLRRLGGEAAASRVGRRGAASVPWPLFGRVPERTHYLPAERRALDPPLREAWSINTHALIEFPPAVAGGVAYVVNKYGNAQSGAAERPQDPLGTEHRPEGLGHADRRDRPGLPPGQGLLRLRRRQPGRRRRRDRQATPGRASSSATSNPRRWRSAARSTSAPTRPTSSPCAPPTARSSGSSTRRPRSKPAPASTTAASSSPTTRAACSASTPRAASCSGAPTPRKVPPFGERRLLLLPRGRLRPRLRRPRRRHDLRLRRRDRQGRLVLPHRQLRLRLARRRQGPRHPAERLHRLLRRALLRARRAHRQAALALRRRRRRCPGTATVIGRTVYTSSFKTGETIGIDVAHPTQDLPARPGRLHADGLRRPPPLPDRLLRADRSAARETQLITQES